ncbi:MAG: MFS transporter, partial [Elusimicrobia bacterium]|nr:MFS transporter [Elusimicrobiota bacterium]
MASVLRSAREVPRGVWLLGFVSLLMDASSELIHSLLPVFLVSTLGATGLEVGLIEGVAEATALVVKVFSGALSDLWGRRKGLAVAGYGLSALSKPFFALAGSVEWVLGARFVDRVGKGVRGAPRDALVADLTPPPLLGAAFGLRQSLDTVGAFIGPLAAIALMLLLRGRFRLVFWFAAVPGALSVALLALGVQEPPEHRAKARPPIHWEALGEMGGAYWKVVLLGAVFTLARFSEAFLILRPRAQGLPDAWAPAVLVLMNVVYSVSAFPVGALADRADRKTLLACGLAALVAADLALARSQGLFLTAVGVALWGLH